MKTIANEMLDELSAGAAASPRRRMSHNLHPRLEDPVQRFLNAMEPDTYVRPHRHTGEDRWELFLALSGAAVVLTFDAAGTVLQRLPIAAEGPTRGVEMPGDTWHTIACQSSGTVLFELKRGPYHKLTDKDFATWAPAEGEPTATNFVAWYVQAKPGDVPPRVDVRGKK